MANTSKEKVYLLSLSKFSQQNCVFYRTEIHRTVMKQPIRTDNLIKQKPRAAVAGKHDRREGLHGRSR